MALKKTVDLSETARNFAAQFDESLPTQFFKGVIGGFPGSGKSVLALGFPKIHYVCFDDSWKNAYKHCRRLGFTPDIVKMDCAEDYVQDGYISKPIILAALKKKVVEALENDEAETVIIDSLTSAYDLIEAISEKDKDPKNKYSKWSLVTNHLLEIFGCTVLAKKNIIIICHWEKSVDEGEKAESASKKWWPKVQSNFRYDFGKEFSNVWNVHIDIVGTRFPSGNQPRKLQVMPSTEFAVVKTGTPLLEDLELPERPDEIYELLKEKGLI